MNEIEYQEYKYENGKLSNQPSLISSMEYDTYQILNKFEDEKATVYYPKSNIKVQKFYFPSGQPAYFIVLTFNEQGNVISSIKYDGQLVSDNEIDFENPDYYFSKPENQFEKIDVSKKNSKGEPYYQVFKSFKEIYHSCYNIEEKKVIEKEENGKPKIEIWYDDNIFDRLVCYSYFEDKLVKEEHYNIDMQLFESIIYSYNSKGFISCVNIYSEFNREKYLLKYHSSKYLKKIISLSDNQPSYDTQYKFNSENQIIARSVQNIDKIIIEKQLFEYNDRYQLIKMIEFDEFNEPYKTTIFDVEYL